MVAMVIAGLFALACWNVLQILVSIINTFKRRRGLYFWNGIPADADQNTHREIGSESEVAKECRKSVNKNSQGVCGAVLTAASGHEL
jgi:hypothetical protein